MLQVGGEESSRHCSGGVELVDIVLDGVFPSHVFHFVRARVPFAADVEGLLLLHVACYGLRCRALCRRPPAADREVGSS